MSFPATRRALVLAAIMMMAGCRTPISRGKSPLVAPQMSPDSVVLEVFRVRFPFGDPEVNGQLWQEVDEQRLPPDVRQRLARNGFRVGLVGGQVPVKLSKLLELADKPVPSGEANQVNVAEMDSRPKVERRRMPIRNGQLKYVCTSDVRDEIVVLLCEGGELCGEKYAKAQAVFAVKAFPQSDGSVRLEIVPELQHDEARQRWIAGQGTFRLEAGRPRRVFDDMTISGVLSPGSMLILTSLPDRPGSLGHHFFTEDDGQLQQKLLLVRLAQTQQIGLLAPRNVLSLP